MDSMSSAGGSADSAEQGFDRRAAHRWAKRQFRELKALLSEVEHVQSEARRQAKDARTRHRLSRTHARLSGLSVQDLARGSGLRLKILLTNSVRTAQDVLDHGYDGLTKIDGIAGSAVQWIELARKANQVQSVDLQLAPDAENWIRADFDLVRALQTLALVGSLIGLPHVAALRQLLAAPQLLMRATTWLRWLFSSGNKKGDIRSRYLSIRSDVEAAHAGGAFEDVVGAVADAHRALDAITAPDAQVLEGWLNSSAELTALLEDLIRARVQRKSGSSSRTVFRPLHYRLNLRKKSIKPISM
jgi:hypothetical protein